MYAYDPSFDATQTYTDWQRYHAPTVIRRCGRGFLEQTRQSDSVNPEHHRLSYPELIILVESYGGLCYPTADQLLLLFADYHWARRCQRQLFNRGIACFRLGCYLQLQRL